MVFVTTTLYKIYVLNSVKYFDHLHNSLHYITILVLHILYFKKNIMQQLLYNTENELVWPYKGQKSTMITITAFKLKYTTCSTYSIFVNSSI